MLLGPFWRHRDIWAGGTSTGIESQQDYNRRISSGDEYRCIGNAIVSEAILLTALLSFFSLAVFPSKSLDFFVSVDGIRGS